MRGFAPILTPVVFILFFFKTSAIIAQEIAPRDSGVVHPFRGQLCYRITWKGKGYDAIRADLPDSVFISSYPEGFLVSWSGGIFNELREKIIWEKNSNRLLVWFPDIEVAWESHPLREDSLKKGKLKKEALTAKILGKNCRQFILNWPVLKVREEFWMWDSLRFDGWGENLDYRLMPPVFYPGLNGLPMRYIKTSEDGVCRMEVKRIIPLNESESLPLPGEGVRIIPRPSVSQRHPALAR